MGYSLCWVAIKGKTEDAIFAELGLRGTGERQEFPEAGFSTVVLPTGWRVIIADHNVNLLDERVLKKLSISCDVVTCMVEEHVMFSSASHWKNGSMVWRVDHDSSHGVEHLDCDGHLPSSFNAIRDELLQIQRTDKSTYQGRGTDHVFDIPVEVARSMTGYRHDRQINGLDKESFERLDAIAPPAKQPQGWLARLFGG